MNNEIKLPSEIIPINQYLTTDVKSSNSCKHDEEPRSDIYFNTMLCNAHRGCVYAEFGATKVAVSISNPRAINPINGIDEQVQINVSVEYKSFATERNDDFELMEFMLLREVKHALESTICINEYTNMAFEVQVLIFQDDGSVLATVINACSVALLLGGISTFDVISASTACLYKDQYFTSPEGHMESLINYEQQKGNYGHMTCTSYAVSKQLAQIYCYGLLKEEHMQKLLENCQKLNDVVKLKIKDVVKNNIKEHLKMEKFNRETMHLARKRSHMIAERGDVDKMDTTSL